MAIQAVARPAPVRRVVPTRRRVGLSEIWTSLPVANMLAVRDYKARNKQSVLGPIWLILQPLGILGTFAVVFQGVAQVGTDGIPFPLFALVGTTVWTFVNATIAYGVRTHIINAKLIKLVPCSRIAYVTSAVTGALPNLLVPLLLTFATLPIYGRGLPLQFVAFPLCLAWLIVFLWSVTNLLAALNVRFRDVSSLVPFLIQGGMFLTPIAYPLSSASPPLSDVLALNPLTGIIESWRWAILGSTPGMLPMIVAMVATVVTAIAGWWVFVRLEPRFADYV
jgi:ABC-type polysaccharide/polyol phosphate export permease